MRNHGPRRKSQARDVDGRWIKVAEWLGAQGPVNLSIYSCLMVSMGAVLANIVQ
jgi:hypothetical protein